MAHLILRRKLRRVIHEFEGQYELLILVIRFRGVCRHGGFQQLPAPQLHGQDLGLHVPQVGVFHARQVSLQVVGVLHQRELQLQAQEIGALSSTQSYPNSTREFLLPTSGAEAYTHSEAASQQLVMSEIPRYGDCPPPLPLPPGHSLDPPPCGSGPQMPQLSLLCPEQSCKSVPSNIFASSPSRVLP